MTVIGTVFPKANVFSRAKDHGISYISLIGCFISKLTVLANNGLLNHVKVSGEF